jgi:hypothetical protein
MFSHSAEKQPSIFFEFFNRIGQKETLVLEPDSGFMRILIALVFSVFGAYSSTGES